MPRSTKRSSAAAGLPPGTLVHVGEKKAQDVTITLVRYDETRFEERDVAHIADCPLPADDARITWINVVGLHEPAVLEELGDHFGFHPLVLEDILNTEQRPKMEDYGDYVFIVLKMFNHNQRGEIGAEQVSLILGPHYVVSFQERPADDFLPVRERLRNSVGRLRRLGPDYLAYTLVDAIVDSYFVMLEEIGDKIETLEEALVADPATATLQQIHHLKRTMLLLHKSVWPLREVIGGLERGETSLIHDSTQVYLRDVYDHTIQAMDAIETFRDMLSGMLDIYLSSISNTMNAVMKVLTIIGTIFIPLTFLAGVYGMNFLYMPELKLRWTYPLLWGVMLAIAATMLIFFRRKRWL